MRLVGTKTLETKSWLVPKPGGLVSMNLGSRVGFNGFLVSMGWGGVGAKGLERARVLRVAGCAGNARGGPWADWPVFGCLVK